MLHGGPVKAGSPSFSSRVSNFDGTLMPRRFGYGPGRYRRGHRSFSTGWTGWRGWGTWTKAKMGSPPPAGPNGPRARVASGSGDLERSASLYLGNPPHRRLIWLLSSGSASSRVAADRAEDVGPGSIGIPNLRNLRLQEFPGSPRRTKEKALTTEARRIHLGPACRRGLPLEAGRFEAYLCALRAGPQGPPCLRGERFA